MGRRGLKRSPMYQAPALIYESIEITLPVSPRQLILLNRRGLSGYVDAPERLFDEYNRRTRFQCAEYFVSNPLKPPPPMAPSRRRRTTRRRRAS